MRHKDQRIAHLRALPLKLLQGIARRLHQEPVPV